MAADPPRPFYPESFADHPPPAIRGAWAYFQRGAARGRAIANPVNDRRDPVGRQDPVCLVQEPVGMLGVEDVEEHHVADAGVWQSSAFSNEIPQVELDIGKARALRLGAGGPDHLGLDVETVDGAANEARCRDGERPIAAAEIDGARRLRRQPQAREDARRIEESIPRCFVGHPAVTDLHAGSIGRPAATQALKPPITSVARAKPKPTSVAAARLDE